MPLPAAELPSAAKPALSSWICDVSVIIVSYNVRSYLDQAIRAVKRAMAGLEVEVWVVDNASLDDSVEKIRAWHPEVQVIANADNPGFGKANNQAMVQAKGRYFFILNPDTIVQEDTLQVLVDFMDAHPECGAVGPQILDPDGRFSPTCRRAFPRPSVALWRILGLSKRFPKSKVFGQYNLTFLDENEVAEVDALSGSVMMVRAAAVLPPYPNAAGLFDASFFMYGEDLDWCFRIQQAGWKIFYTPQTRILHYKGESTDKNDLRYVKAFYGAMAVFMEKHFAGQYSKAFVWAMRGAVQVRAGLAAFMQQIRKRLPAAKSKGEVQVYAFMGSVAAFQRLKEWPAKVIHWQDDRTLPDDHDLILSEADLATAAMFDLMQAHFHPQRTFLILSATQNELIGPQQVWRF